MNIQDWTNTATNRLTQTSCSTARLDILVLLEHVLGKDRTWILTHPESNIPTVSIQTLDSFLRRRLEREPLAYILGKKEFYGRNFVVTPDVLIPRPESEDIIEATKSLNCTNFIDLGSGSGCLAISIALEIGNSKVIASDISEKALVIARKNAKNLNAKVDFVTSDLFESLGSSLLGNDLCIIANLPYVPDGLITSPEIKTEPKIALFAGNDGMDMYRKFWQEVRDLDQKKPKFIITESLMTQHDAMSQFGKESGFSLQKTLGLIQLFNS